MAPRRFIDYAQHGGCSAKLDAPRLRDLLAPLAGRAPGFPDAVVTEVGEQSFASSVDVVLPMIDDPELFGRIVVAHVLSDLYAVGATPAFALTVLAVPKLSPGEQDPDAARGAIDGDVQKMLLAADGALAEQKIARVGGHSLLLETLIFGLAATGVMPAGGGVSNDDAQPGDVLILTKPVGTSIATKTWKGAKGPRSGFEDVIDWMLRSNEQAAAAMLELERCACTDVTGFGLLGHLHNMLAASGKAANVRIDDVPVYESVSTAIPKIEPDHNTRIFDSNMAYVREKVRNLGDLDLKQRLLFFDAQISGGLLVSVPEGAAGSYLAALRDRNESGWAIGSVTEGSPGAITLV